MAYELEANNNYALGAPLITTLIVKFYTSEKSMLDAFRAHDVDNINGISPDAAADLKKQGATIKEGALPRIFAVYFNQSSNKALSQLEVRQAFNMSIDRTYIIKSVLNGFGSPT